eukprot:NODE_1_length_95616_cov_0.657642.p81 type:complete len:102 gc:universal NODE_1_length_95616_cov_0.657642:54283-54588(+)
MVTFSSICDTTVVLRCISHGSWLISTVARAFGLPIFSDFNTTGFSGLMGDLSLFSCFSGNFSFSVLIEIGTLPFSLESTTLFLRSLSSRRNLSLSTLSLLF